MSMQLVEIKAKWSNKRKWKKDNIITFILQDKCLFYDMYFIHPVYDKLGPIGLSC